MKSKLRDAFETAADGYSPDRVIADPNLNARYISACRKRGLDESDAALNRFLLNLCKSGALKGRSRSRRTHFADENEYRFASEMAARFLERRDQTSLDDIIGDPEVAAEFDGLAGRIAPGYSPLQYRWAALNLRKSRRFVPELAVRVAPPVQVLVFSVAQLSLNDLPVSQGIYLLYSPKKLLYVGETENLRARLKKHLDHSDNKGLARWMWESGTAELHVEIQVLEEFTLSRARKALELELIRSRQPVFNVQR